MHRDHHIEVAKALYSVPGNLIGTHVDVRADRQLVRVYYRGQLVKPIPAPAPAAGSPTPPTCPRTRRTYAMRDLGYLQRLADDAGPAIGAYAAALLDHPLPWTKMRQVYALLGLVKKWGPGRVEAACARALEAEAVSVALIGRMLERGTEAQHLPHTRAAPAASLPAPAVRPRPPPTSPSHAAAGHRPGGARHEPARAGHHPRAAVAAAPGQARPAACAPSPSGSPWPAPATSATPSSWSWSSPTRSPAATPPPRSAARRAAGLDAAMRLERFDDTAKITYDRPGLGRAVLAAVRRRRPQRDDHGPGRGGQDLPGHRAGPRRHPRAATASTSSAPTACSNASEPPGSTTATTPRSASSCASTC